MKKLLLSSSVIIILLIGWLNIKDQSEIIQADNLSAPKSTKSISLNPFEEKIILEAPKKEILKPTSTSSLPAQLSPSSSSLSPRALPIASLDFNAFEDASNKTAMEKYLKDSSDLAFPDNTDVSLALFEARDGNPAKMASVIQSFKEKLPRLEALVPPPELKEFHEKSLMSIKNYVVQLEKIRQNAGNKEKILEILNSREMNDARNLAREVLTNLRGIVKKYNLSLPKEVLPDDKIPDPNKK
ncbi:MAG: hypothetical protein ABIJ94_01470 [candidate division WOR-3 bacterium]